MDIQAAASTDNRKSYPAKNREEIGVAVKLA
jgi:hypothetical protein